MALALIRHLPRLRYSPPAPDPLVPGEFPELAADLHVITRKLEPTFARLDERALRAQNRHRLLRLAIIAGATVAALLGVWQTAADDAAVPSALATGVGAAVTALAWWTRKRHYQRRFLNARLSAERLRSEAFLFLARTAGYDADDRTTVLAERVTRIEQAGTHDE